MKKENELKWSPIVDYEGYYEINSLGTVRSIERLVDHPISGKIKCRKRYITTRINNWGYRQLVLSKNGKATTHSLHRLLAKTFIPNPFNKAEINHKNGIKIDNCLENLEWCTRKENLQHAYQNGLINKSSQRKPVIDISTGLVFEKVKEAADHFSVSLSTCKNYLNGNRKNITPLRYYSNHTLIQASLHITMWLAPNFTKATTPEQQVDAVNYSRKLYGICSKVLGDYPQWLTNHYKEP